MFYTELDPYTMEKVYVPKTAQEKAMQRALLQYFRPQNQRRVIEALIAARRTDLIGNTPDCLVKPDKEYLEYQRRRSDRNVKNTRNGGKNSAWQKGKAAPQRAKAAHQKAAAGAKAGARPKANQRRKG